MRIAQMFPQLLTEGDMNPSAYEDTLSTDDEFSGDDEVIERLNEIIVMLAF